jgi:hypothetical protein
VNLLKPLVLESAKIENVALVPTKAFFKPVLVVSAPATVEEAKLFCADWLFDDGGLPRSIDGAVKLHGALAGAMVELIGAHQTREVGSEEVAHVAFYREEKKAMRIRLRIHFPEDARLGDLLEFLAELNKAEFRVTVTDRQGSLVPRLAGREVVVSELSDIVATADADGFYDERYASVRPFKEGKIEAAILVLETAEGFRSGWRLVSKLTGADPLTAGEVLSTDRLALPSELDARTLACREMWLRLPILKPKGPKEQKQVAALDAWLTDLDPKLATAEREPASQEVQ